MVEVTANPSEITNSGMKREIGLLSSVNFLINMIIGSGIFIAPGKVLASSGSVGMMLTIWVAAGCIEFTTCLPYGELSTVVPKSGSFYIYLLTAFRDLHPSLGGLPAFVFFWVQYGLIRPATSAIGVIMFAEYFYVVLQNGLCEDLIPYEAVIKYLIGVSVLVVIGVINCVSVKFYIRSQDLLTYTKMGTIFFTVCCGLYLTISGQAQKYDPGFSGTHWSVAQLAQALYFGLYSCGGGEDITGITEELKNPEKNIMYTLIITLTISTVMYLLLNLTFLAALSPAEVANGTTVISDFAYKLFGPSGGSLAAAIICLCLLATLMCELFYSSRLGFVAAREGHVAEILCYTHKTRHTPAPAVIVQVLLTLILFTIGGDIAVLIDMDTFFSWISYVAAMIALVILRNKMPLANRPFKVPYLVVAVNTTISCCLVVVAFWSSPIELDITFIVSLSVIFFMYYIFVYKVYKINYFDKLQKVLQNQFMLVPLTEEQKY